LNCQRLHSRQVVRQSTSSILTHGNRVKDGCIGVCRLSSMVSTVQQQAFLHRPSSKSSLDVQIWLPKSGITRRCDCYIDLLIFDHGGCPGDQAPSKTQPSGTFDLTRYIQTLLRDLVYSVCLCLGSCLSYWRGCWHLRPHCILIERETECHAL
jgi:hypothetical protein